MVWTADSNDIAMTFSAHARSRARRLAMQALYQWDLSGADMAEIRSQFAEQEDFSKADAAYFTGLLNEVVTHAEAIDSTISGNIDRPFKQLDPVERAILRLATYELLYRTDVPFRVVIDEAVSLTKKFGAEQGHSFVNGVLDKTAHQHRPDECARVSNRVSDR
ncbi:MAG: transcription antitermination factor NusB [Gammaproteobacteria bacterium]